MIGSLLKESILDYIDTQASLMVLILDGTGLILEANQYCEQLVGERLTQKMLHDIIIDFTDGVSIPDLLYEEDRKHLIHIKTARGLPQSLHFRFRKVGSQFLAIGEVNSIETEALRKELLAANSELSNLGRELQKRNAELVKLNDLKNQFLGMAAHDLRNPISIIYSFSTFLLDQAEGHPTERHADFLASIRNSSEFMLHLLDQLLDIAKIESGKVHLNKEPTDIVDFVAQNVQLNRVLARKKGISIQFNHYEPIPKIDMDRHKIDQVLNNLISNAVKFSPPEAVITVDVFRSGEHVTVSVKDEGPGIPDEERDKLFKPFSKTSARPTGGEKTTGLGLSIVKKIICGHLGKIWLESTVDKGSNFCFSLPFSSDEEGNSSQ